ncbi:MAG: LacI family DNA-binding transcriptional regulator [Aestuariibacter sp.]
MKATIKDVAKLAGVSIKTVSRVINRESSVKPETEKKVSEAIQQLQYQPNSAARNLAGTQSFAIGYVYDNPNAYYVISMQNGILKECQKNGFELIIHPCDAASDNILEEIKLMIRRSQLAGLILSPPLSETPKVMEFLDEMGVHYVRVLSGSHTSDARTPCVYIDDRKAAHEIGEHIISAGHERIAFLSGDKHHQSTGERLEGFITALKEHNIKSDKKLIIEGEYSFQSGVEGAKKLLAMKNPPTAIFACNDEIAAGALFAARLMGKAVPDDVAIAGFEDSPFSRQTWPKLTTAAQPMDQVAKQAASLLIKHIISARRRKKEPVQHHYFEPQLIVRESTQHDA